MDDLTPQTRQEAYMAAMAGEGVELPEAPLTRREKYMAKFLGQDVETPTPVSREDQYWEKIIENGGGGTERYTYVEIPLKAIGHTIDAENVAGALDYVSNQVHTGAAALGLYVSLGNHSALMPLTYAELFDDEAGAGGTGAVFATSCEAVTMSGIQDILTNLGIDDAVAVNVTLVFEPVTGSDNWHMIYIPSWLDSALVSKKFPEEIADAAFEGASLRIVAMLD